MKVEEALIEVADRPLRRSPYSGILVAVLRAFLPGDGSVTLDTTGQQALTEIYNLPNDDLQERILNRELGSVRNRDSYRTVLLGVSSVVGSVAVIVAGVEIFNAGTEHSGEAMNLLSRVVGGVVSVVQFILGF